MAVADVCEPWETDPPEPRRSPHGGKKAWPQTYSTPGGGRSTLSPSRMNRRYGLKPARTESKV